MSTARWELQTAEVPISRVRVMSGVRGGGFHIQFGELVLWVASEAHWSDINEQVMQCFDSLAPKRPVPLPRTDSVNVAGACWGEDK